jgi:hypothetical protein
MAITDILKRTLQEAPTSTVKAQVPPGQLKPNPTIGGDSVRPGARLGQTPTVLAKLRVNPVKAAGGALGTGLELGGAIRDAHFTEGMSGLDKVARYGESAGRLAAAGLGATLGATAGSVIPLVGTTVGGLGLGTLGYFSPDIVRSLAKTLTGADIQLPSERADELRNTLLANPGNQPAEPAQEQPQQVATPFPQESANTAADAIIDKIISTQPAQGPASQAVSADPLAGIRDTLAQAQSERAKVQNPLQQQVNIADSGAVTSTKGDKLMQLQDYSDNPLAAAMQLNQAISLAVPGAAANKQARANSDALTKQASAEADLVKLADTLKSSGITQEKAQIELDQAKAVQEAIGKLSLLDDTQDPDGKQRTALRQSILTMMGKEPKDGFELKEFGGGTDPATGMPLPKRLALFNPRSGKVEFLDGGEAQAPAQQKFEVGKVYQLPGSNKVLKFVGYDDKGEPKFNNKI